MCVIFCSSDQESNMTSTQKMINSFLSSVNMEVASSVSGIQVTNLGDLSIVGDRNEVGISQLQEVDSQNFVDMLSSQTDTIKTSMMSDMEAVLSNDKSLNGIQGGGFVTPLGPAGAGSMAGLAGTTSTTSNISTEMENILTMSDVINKVVKSQAISEQLINIGDVSLVGSDNNVDISQNAAIKQVTKALMENHRIKDLDSNMETKSRASLTTHNGSGKTSMMIAISLIGMAIVSSMFNTTNKDKKLQEQIKLKCDGFQRGAAMRDCIKDVEKSLQASKRSKLIFKVIFGLLVVGAVVTMIVLLFKIPGKILGGSK